MADHLDVVLAQWREQRPDLDTGPMGVIGRISRLAKIVDTELTRTFARHGLDRSSFDVLATLRRNGRSLTPTELMRSSMITSGAVTQRLDRLEDRGLVRRSPSAADGRGVLIDLTDAGRELLDRVLPDHLATENRLLAALPGIEKAKLAGTLRTLLESLGDATD